MFKIKKLVLLATTAVFIYSSMNAFASNDDLSQASSSNSSQSKIQFLYPEEQKADAFPLWPIMNPFVASNESTTFEAQASSSASQASTSDSPAEAAPFARMPRNFYEQMSYFLSPGDLRKLGLTTSQMHERLRVMDIEAEDFWKNFYTGAVGFAMDPRLVEENIVSWRNLYCLLSNLHHSILHANFDLQNFLTNLPLAIKTDSPLYWHIQAAVQEERSNVSTDYLEAPEQYMPLYEKSALAGFPAARYALFQNFTRVIEALFPEAAGRPFFRRRIQLNPGTEYLKSASDILKRDWEEFKGLKGVKLPIEEDFIMRVFLNRDDLKDKLISVGSPYAFLFESEARFPIMSNGNDLENRLMLPQIKEKMAKEFTEIADTMMNLHRNFFRHSLHEIKLFDTMQPRELAMLSLVLQEPSFYFFKRLKVLAHGDLIEIDNIQTDTWKDMYITIDLFKLFHNKRNWV